MKELKNLQDDREPISGEWRVSTNCMTDAGYLGGAVQWDPYEWYDLTEAQRQTVYDRIAWLRPAFIRCLIRAYWYCNGFDSNRQPIYDWHNRRMERVYEILDYCQRHDIDVLFGDWHAPWFDVETDPALNRLSGLGISTNDERWIMMNADLLHYLVAERGYTCIKLFNLCNEPNVSRSVESFEQWAEGVRLMNAALQARGLNEHIQLAGPDSFLNDSDWLGRSLEELSGELGVYEVHLYADLEEIRKGRVEERLKVLREQVHRSFPERRLFLGEAGIATGVTEGDKQPNTRTYWYGIAMADVLVQSVRAGLSGAVAWNLDDCAHLNNVSDPLSYDLKQWGFWNSVGARMGMPEDEAPRPWYYAWSLLSRGLRRNARPALSVDPEIDGLRLLAFWIGEGDERELSCVMVNYGDQGRTVRLLVTDQPPGARYRFKQYGYDTAGWERGFAGFFDAPSETEYSSEGMVVQLPPNSVVLLTTMTLSE